MAFFDRFRNKPTNLENWYVDNNKFAKDAYQSEKETIEKSLHKGRAQYTTAVGSLDVGVSNESTISKGTIYERKQMLKNASRNIIVQSIIRTRTNQVLHYSRPARYSNDGAGFKISLRQPTSNGKLSKKQQDRIKQLENFIYNTGWVWTPQRGQGFSQFISEFIFNHYVYDQINTELIRDEHGKLDHFNMVDGSTVLLKKLPKSKDAPRTFIQYPDATLSHGVTFSEKDLTFVTYNNHADNKRYGYGYSAVEASLSELGYQMDVEQFNARFFAQGGTTRGILLLDTGAGSTQQNTAALNSLRREWQASFSGVNGAWKIPVVSANDAKFINMTQSTKDMEFENYQDFIVNTIANIFAIQPDEINYPNKGGGTTGRATKGASLNEGNTQKAKYQQSQAKGLKPLMQFIEDFINNYILREVAPDYYFQFTLGDAKDELQQEQVDNMRLKNGMTINEVRKLKGLPALPNGLGDYPGDATVAVQFLQTEAKQDQVFQAAQQSKNDNNPTKANHGQPESGMQPNQIDPNKTITTSTTKKPTKKLPKKK